MPKIFPTAEVLWGLPVEELSESVHRWAAYTMLGLAVVRVAAVVKYKWIDGHDVMYRMSLGNAPVDES